MKVSTEPVENSQKTLTIEMEPEEVEKHLQRAYGRLVRRVSIPGFRKGKAPRTVLESRMGKDALLREALEDLLPAAYGEAAQGQEIDAIAGPRFELVQTEPLIFKAVVPLRPKIKLGDYAQIRVETKPVEISDKDLEEAISQLRDQQAVLSPVERPVQLGDVVSIDVKEGQETGSPAVRKDVTYEVAKETRLPLPGFGEKLLGMSKGEERSFVLSYPMDYEIQDLAGKEYAFTVTISEIKEKKLPEVDDGFAKALGKEDMKSLREQVASTLKARAEERARLELEQKAIDALIGISEVDYPPILVENEIERLLMEEARHFTDGIIGLERYLKSLGKTMEGHLEELRPMASKRVVRSLVLGKLAEAEKIEVSDSEIDAEIEKMTQDAGKQSDEAGKLFAQQQARDSIKQFLAGRKTIQRLAEISKG